MNGEEIIRMAQEAGIKGPLTARQGFRMFASPYRLQRFATLVAAAEREACAKVCEGLGVHPALNVFNGGPEWYKHGKDCAAAIRARGRS